VSGPVCPFIEHIFDTRYQTRYHDDMNDPLAAVEDAVRALRTAWAGEEGLPLAAVTGLGGSRLIAVNDAIGTIRRQLDAVHAPIAAEIARESRRELGPDSLS